jgi:hypothetical protein
MHYVRHAPLACASSSSTFEATNENQHVRGAARHVHILYDEYVQCWRRMHDFRAWMIVSVACHACFRGGIYISVLSNVWRLVVNVSRTLIRLAILIQRKGQIPQNSYTQREPAGAPRTSGWIGVHCIALHCPESTQGCFVRKFPFFY